MELKAGPAQNTNLNPNCIWRGILTVARISRNPDCPESRSADRRTGGSQRVSSDGQRRQDVVAVRIRRAVSRGATRGRRCHECTGHDTGARIGHAAGDHALVLLAAGRARRQQDAAGRRRDGSASYLPHHGLKSWLRRNRFERRIMLEPELDGVVLMGALQSRKCRLLLAERIVNQSDAE